MCQRHSSNLQLSRREILKSANGLGLLGLGTMAAPGFSLEQHREDPRFFLHVHVFGGLDGSYLFDSRPRSFVSAGKKALYLDEEPTIWRGANGGQCWATAQTAPLQEFAENFTVLNGVQMATGFDGHDQNSNFLATGNPFGGEYFLPQFNHGSGATLLDFVQTGFFFPFETTNSQNSVPFNNYVASSLVKRIKSSSNEGQRQVRDFVARRMASVGEGNGKMAAGSRAMLSGYQRIPELSRILGSMEIASSEGNLANTLNVLPNFLTRASADRRSCRCR